MLAEDLHFLSVYTGSLNFEHLICQGVRILKLKKKKKKTWVLATEGDRLFQLVLQQTYHILTHTSPHRVTSSNIYQIKAQSIGSSKLHDATVRTVGGFFFTALQQRVPLIPLSKALTDKCI